MEQIIAEDSFFSGQRHTSTQLSYISLLLGWWNIEQSGDPLYLSRGYLWPSELFQKQGSFSNFRDLIKDRPSNPVIRTLDGVFQIKGPIPTFENICGSTFLAFFLLLLFFVCGGGLHKKMVIGCFLVIYAIAKTTFPDQTNQERTRLHHTVADQIRP